MKGYLIFDLKLANYILKKKYFFLNKKNVVFITDKISIYELFKAWNIQIICLDGKINDKKRKEIFLQNYLFIDKKIKNLGKNNYLIFNKIKLNTIHNTNKFEVFRCYVGIKYLYHSLKIVIKEKKIKEIIFFEDLGSNLLCKNFYTKIIEFFCNKNKLIFNTKKINRLTIFESIASYFKYVLITILKFREATFKKLINFLYQKFFIFFSNKLFNKKQIASIGPLFDLAYLKNNFLDTGLNKLLKVPLKKQKEENLIHISKRNFNNLDDIFIWYLKEKNDKNIEFYREIISKAQNYFEQKRIKKIFWGVSPEPLLRNLIEYLKKKKYSINGLQHGGKYFIMNDDLYHKDSDYYLCNNYFSYGFPKTFNKKKYARDIKILNSGCFKSFKYENTFKKIEKLNNDTILYIPIGLSKFLMPVIETSPTTRFFLQKKICKTLDEIRNFKKFVKILPLSYFKNITLNYNQLEANPIYFELHKYKSLKINSHNLISSYKNLKPKIIIMDSLSTPLYELSSSNSEIILFLDKFNQPKKDVLSILKKRFFIVKNIKEMMSCINLISNGKKNKFNDNSFYEKFYKQKKFNLDI